MSAVLDTHTAIWYLFSRKQLSNDALNFIREAIDHGKPVYISAISLVETIYLIERGRILLRQCSGSKQHLKPPIPACSLHRWMKT